MSNNTLKPKGVPQCPQDAAYMLGKRHNTSDLARKLGISAHKKAHWFRVGSVINLKRVRK